ncbi:MAG TPA: ABC transporter permease [Chthoniobacterales bacterium]|jgi:putative ABC transport system permease protein
MSDLRYAVRQLFKSPGFTAVAVLTLSLGIGANSAIFSVINAVLLKALPYPQADRIVLVWGDASKQGLHRGQVSSTDVADWRARSHAFAAISTYANFRPILVGQGEPERVAGAQVGDDFFKVMGARPLLGRVFDAEEQEEGKDNVAVLSYGMWQRRLGGVRDVIGRKISLSGHPYTVIGVMPENFRSLPAGLLERPAEFYRPVAEPPNEKERSGRHLRAIARLKSGVTFAQAQTEMTLIARQLEQEHPESNTATGVRLVSLRDDLVGPVRPVLVLLFGAVGFLLLIACANVGNLLLARTMGRQREVAIRAALGASRGDLARQFLTEGVLLTSLGGALGLLIAAWSTTLLEHIGARFFPHLGGIPVDARVLVFTFGISLGAGVFLGLVAAWRAGRGDLSRALNDAGRSPGAVSTRSSLRSSLVVIEVALAMVLLIGAGLLLKSMRRLQQVDPGFDPAHLLTMNVWLPAAKYPRTADYLAFYQRLGQRLQMLPGIAAAGLTSVLPASDNFDRRTIQIEGQPQRPGEQPEVDNYAVTPNYLRALAVPLRAGRILSERDHSDSPFVVLVSESLARRFWPNESAVGKRVRLDRNEAQEPWRMIVGVVGDVKQYGLDRPGTMALYEPLPQFPSSAMTLVVRTQSDPGKMINTVRHQILALDPEQAPFKIATMEQLLSDSTALRRFALFLLGVFAGLAVLLATIGLYGVISYSVAQRTRELGIRLALGAQRRDLLNLVVREGMRFVFIGVATGLVASIAFTRVMASLLFGVSTTDPFTFVAWSLALGVVALLACVVPARRASSLEPMTALRAD